MKKRIYEYCVSICQETLKYDRNGFGEFMVINYGNELEYKKFNNYADAEKYANEKVASYKEKCDQFNEKNPEDYQYVYANCVENEMTPSHRFVGSKHYIIDTGIFQDGEFRKRLNSKINRLGHKYIIR